MDYLTTDLRLAYPEGPPPMPDADEAHRWSTAVPTSPGGTRARRELTVAEVQEFAALRVMMRSDAYMTDEQCRRWFELWQRHDLMHG